MLTGSAARRYAHGMLIVRVRESHTPSPGRPGQSQKPSAAHPAGIGRQLWTLDGAASVEMPQQVHRSSQYSAGPHVADPHRTGPASLVLASGIPIGQVMPAHETWPSR